MEPEMRACRVRLPTSVTRTQYVPASTVVLMTGSVAETVTTVVVKRQAEPSHMPRPISIASVGSPATVLSVIVTVPLELAAKVLVAEPPFATEVGRKSAPALPVGGVPVVVTTRTRTAADCVSDPASVTVTQ